MSGISGPSSMSPIVSATSSLGLNLMQQTVADNHNVIMSPHSVAQALRMVLAGARGETRSAMAEHLGGDPEAIESGVTRLNEIARDPASGVTLRDANQVRVRNSVTLRPEYQAYVERIFNAQALPLSVGDEGAINAWIARITENKIRDMLSQGTIQYDTAVMLINAVYFYGKWNAQFDAQWTTDKPFYMVGGESVHVPTMQRKAKFAYQQLRSDLEGILLPYTEKNFSMMILLPSEAMTFSAFMARYDIMRQLDDLQENLLFTNPRKGTVFLPRFRVESDTNYNTALQAMGMGIAFDQGGEADFSGMIEETDPGIYLSDVIQRAVVEVDEKGTEAAAATYAVMTTRGISLDREKPFVMRIDRPFFMAIQHNRSGLPLFMGWMADPSRRG